ncbi:MAG: hypothetical protein KC503_07050 [Myxococcales bacterium]|nr:hypothetical protein [Myxococcales bacterium]
MSDSAIPAPDLDASKTQRLARGEVIVENETVAGVSAPMVRAYARIDAPPERVWPLIDQTANYERTMVGVKRSEELKRDGNRIHAKVTVGMPFPLRDLTSVTEAVHTVEPGVAYQRRWKLLSGDYQRNEGSWALFPFPGAEGATLVRYELCVEPNIRIPKKLQNFAQTRTVPKLIDRLRELSR